LTKYHAMKTYGGVEIQLDAFLTSALDGGEWSVHAAAALSPGERPWYQLYRKLSGPHSRSVCGDKEKEFVPPPAVEARMCSP
jgi:hypothetical protein